MAGIVREEIIGDCRMILGDCLEILPTLPNVDAVFADPPYGVGYKGSATKNGVDDKNSYNLFNDTPDNVLKICVPAIVLCIKISRSMALTPGIACQRMYPKPDGEGCVWYPSGANIGPWGFITHQPIYYYGKCPYLAKGKGSRPTGFKSVECAEKNGHPCPKPIHQTEWIVLRVSLMHNTVLDPFMGSGTTGVACINLNRKFIGIEIDENYFDIACRRIEKAWKNRPMLFNTIKKEKEKQARLF